VAVLVVLARVPKKTVVFEPPEVISGGYFFSK